MAIAEINPIYDNRIKTSFKSAFFIPVFFLVALTIAMFGNVIFTPKDIILSSPNTDLTLQFIPWRTFGFGELKKGNLALWNPYIFSGMPYLGEFQSALLYPLNLIYIFMPVHKAINISIALHVFLAGLFMYLWTSYRKLHPLACLFSSALFMFCGAHFLHIYAGHLPNLCAIAWAPLIFLAIDGLFEYRSLNWCILGIFAITMQILAGHPQYVFYTAVSVMLYSGFCLIKASQRLKITLGIFIMYAGAFALGAAQILTGMQTMGESVRKGGVPFEFASMFSFPPENFITLLTPEFFGNNISFPYWGRCYLWEMSLFLSVTAVILALYGSIYGNRNLRRFSLTMTLLLAVLALGVHTPLFHFLYRWVPGFNLFRGNSKFIFLASLFLILLAGIGLDQIIRSRVIPKAIIIVILFTGALFLVTAVYLQSPGAQKITDGLWHYLAQMIQATKESYLPENYYKDFAFIRHAKILAAKNMVITGMTCLLISLLLLLRRFSHRVPYIIALIGIFEIFVFAKHSLVKFDFARVQRPELKKFASEYTGNDRVLYLFNPNNTMSFRIQNIWGHDPGILKRYAEFMAFTQGVNPDSASQYLEFAHFHPLYKMLRCRYVFSYKDNGINIIDAGTSMPHLILINDWVFIPRRNDIFTAIESPNFDPTKTVILEKQPDPLPVKTSKQAGIQIINSSTDHLTIEANLAAPAILLITDAYSSGWRVKALEGSHQKKYEVMPANYILRAIPLSKGYHHFRLEYMPLGFVIGKWVSLISLIIYTGLLGWYFKNAFNKH